MKKIFLLVLIAVFPMSIFAQKAQKMVVVFNVEMHGNSCENKIKKNIAYEQGVQDIKTSLRNKTVTVTYNSKKSSVNRLVAAFRNIGYQAVPMEVGCVGSKGGCINAAPAVYNTMR